MDVVYLALGCRALAVDGRHGGRLRQARRAREMTWMYVLGSVVAVGLLVYLVAALLFPEKFS